MYIHIFIKQKTSVGFQKDKLLLAHFITNTRKALGLSGMNQVLSASSSLQFL